MRMRLPDGGVFYDCSSFSLSEQEAGAVESLLSSCRLEIVVVEGL